MASSNNDNRKTIDQYASKRKLTKKEAEAASRKAMKGANGSRDKHGALLVIGVPTLAILTIVALFVVLTVLHHTKGTSKKAATSTSASVTPSPSKTPQQETAEQRRTKGPWNRPTDQVAQVKLAGLSLTPNEQLAVHYHAHLDMWINGKKVIVPALLGINANADGSAPEHGEAGVAPLHTHDTTGVLHVEAAKNDRFTLAQVFDEWGVYSGGERHLGGYSDSNADISVYVNGTPVKEFKEITLAAHQEIAIVITTSASAPKVVAPSTYKFPSGL